MSTALDARKATQVILGTEQDGIFGNNTMRAFTDLATAPDDAPWPPVAQETALPPIPQGMATFSAINQLPSKLPWTAEIDGDDLVVRNIKATCFGGAYDAGDNGQTESGVMNDGSDPNLMGVALPIRSTEAATKDSPLAFKGPHIPWKTKVIVWRGDEETAAKIECALLDNGPDVSEYPDHALDVTEAVAAMYSPEIPRNKLANTWSMDGFSYRIIGGAKYIS